MNHESSEWFQEEIKLGMDQLKRGERISFEEFKRKYHFDSDDQLRLEIALGIAQIERGEYSTLEETMEEIFGKSDDL